MSGSPRHIAYSSPQAIIGGASDYALHPLRGVLWAAFWGSLAAAGIVIAHNYWKVGKRGAAAVTAIIGVVATVGIFAIMFTIPEATLDRIPNFVFLIPQIGIAYVAVKVLQGELLEKHESSGGDMNSAWPSVGIGAVTMFLMIGCLVFYAFAADDIGQQMEFGNDEVYYAGDATAADAEKLAAILEADELFGEDGATARIFAANGEYTVSIVVGDSSLDKETLNLLFEDTAQLIVEGGFPKPLTFELCDEYLTVLHSIVID